MNYWIKCVKKYAVFSGRARRREYLLFGLINWVITFALEYCVTLFGQIASYLLYAFSIAMFLPCLAVSVRRLHDIGKSGGSLLTPVIFGVIGVVLLIIGGKVHGNVSELNMLGGCFLFISAIVYFFLCLAMMVRDSEKNANAYGPNPKSES